VTATFQTLCQLDAKWTAAGIPGLTRWWKPTLKRFYEHTTARALVAQVGRGGAKSHTSAKVGVNETLFGDWKVPAGERHYWAYVAKNKDEAAQRLTLIESLLRALSIPFHVSGDEIELTDVFENGGGLRGFRVFACQVGAVSGFRCYGFSADELAKWQNPDGAQPAGEVCASLGAMTITHPGARRLLISSPFGTDGYHYERMREADTSSQLAVQAASWVANPDGITEAATHAVESDPKIHSREYAAIASSTISSAFEEKDVRACFGRTLVGRGQASGFITIDASSLRGDAFAWLEGRLTDAGEIQIEQASGWDDEQQRGLSMQAVVDHLAERCKVLGTQYVYGDQRESASLAALFAQHRIELKSFAWSEPSKDAAVVTVRRWMREGKLALCDHEQLKRELLTMRARLTPGGRVIYLANGKDYASALITLAHAQNEGELVMGTGNAMMDRMLEVAKERASGPGTTRSNYGIMGFTGVDLDALARHRAGWL
jgi:hypothetical protein